MRQLRLEEDLRKLKVPAPEPSAQQRAWSAVRLALQQRELEPVPPRSMGWRRPVFACGALAAAVLLAAVFEWIPALDRLQSSSHPSWQQIVARHQQYFDELHGLFADHLLAVIDSSDGCELRLSDRASRTSDQPVLVQICKEGTPCEQVITFSGQTVQIKLADEIIPLEPLITGSGQILVSGPGFLWKGGDTLGRRDLWFKADRLKAG